MKFGDWLILNDENYPLIHDKHNKIKIYCRCLLCHKEKYVDKKSLLNNKSTNCGCKFLLYKVGTKWGNLIIKGRRENPNSRNVYLELLCSCGKELIVSTNSFKKRKTLHCGCLKIKISSKPEYKIWVLMKQRCYNHKSSNYKYYGGRGIKVCEKWKNSFDNFYFDMGERPFGCWIERKNNNEDYSPENCCWIDKSYQQQNKRKLHKSTSVHKGVSYDKSKNKWSSYISKNKKRIYLGGYKTEEEAAYAYNFAVDILYTKNNTNTKNDIEEIPINYKEIKCQILKKVKFNL